MNLASLLIGLGLAGLLVVPGAAKQDQGLHKEPVVVVWKPDNGKLREHNSTQMERVVRLALKWLLNHQNPAGYWDCDGPSPRYGQRQR